LRFETKNCLRILFNTNEFVIESMNKLGIWGIAIAFAFVLGTIFSTDIATAVKPVTEVFVTNTDPIPVTGIVSSAPTQASALKVDSVGLWTPDGCTEGQAGGGLAITWFGESPADQFSARWYDGWITQVEVTETDFEAKGIYFNVKPSCVLGSRELPKVITITGECGEGVPIEITTEGGTDVSGLGNVACVP